MDVGGGADSAPPPLLRLFMAPPDKGGDDANDGLTPQTPVESIVRAHGILGARKPKTDVEIRILQGTYVAPPFHGWRVYVPGHTISFMPQGYVRGQGVPAGGRPIFRNANCGSTHCTGFWLMARLPKASSDPLYNGGTSGLRFYYLQLERYSSGGLSIYGDSERDVEDETYSPPLSIPGSQGLDGNTIFGMRFYRLGSKWSGGKFGYGGVVLTNSSDNRIENNHFVDIENASPYGGYIHGVYITHFSSSNKVERNRFSNISGDPVKVRNRSNYNAIEHNTFTRTGRTSYYRGEFCDLSCAKTNGIARQCASYHNRFFSNTLDSGYSGAQISTWSLDPPGLTYPGVSPCSIPGGDQRLRTGYNTKP